MPSTVRTSYRNLAILTAVFVYLLIIAGGVVRVTESGLGCPDWPTCYGSLLPPRAERVASFPEGTALVEEMGGIQQATLAATVEYTHRIIALMGGLLLLLTIAFAWLRYRTVRWISIPAALITALLVVQVPLGGIVVITELEPLLVAIHLGIALLIFSLTLTIAFYASQLGHDRGERSVGSGVQRRRAVIVTASLFAVLMFGAAVVGSNTGLSCPDWPTCNVSGNVILVPPAGFSLRVWFHLLHRYTVAAFTGLLIWAFVKTQREQGHLRAFQYWNYALAGLFVAQVTIGALQVWLSKPPLLRALHLAVASGVWAALTMIVLLNYHGARRHT